MLFFAVTEDFFVFGTEMCFDNRLATNFDSAWLRPDFDILSLVDQLQWRLSHRDGFSKSSEIIMTGLASTGAITAINPTTPVNNSTLQ